MNASTKAKWFSSRAIWAHITLIALVPAFLALGDWQLHRALSGNYLSWAYTIEWPVFAVYAFYTWYKIIHDDVKEIPEVLRREIGAPGLPKLANKDTSTQTADNEIRQRGSDSLSQGADLVNASFHKVNTPLPKDTSSQNGVPSAEHGTDPANNDEINIPISPDRSDSTSSDNLDDVDRQLLLYNEYLSQLNNENKRKSWF